MLHKAETNREKMLVAALIFEEEFALEQLCVRCWTLFPREFGLEGFEVKYPDFHQTSSDMASERKANWSNRFEKTGRKRYRLTEMGRREGEDLIIQAAKPVNGVASLRMDQERWLAFLIACPAWDKFTSGLKADIIYSEALVFWSGVDRRKNTESFITLLYSLTDDSGITLSTGMELERTVAISLRELNDYLAVRFSTKLSRGAKK